MESTSRDLRVALLGRFGAGNLGNDASLEAMVQLIRRVEPGAEIICACPNPDEIRERFRVHACTTHARRPTHPVLASKIAWPVRASLRASDFIWAKQVCRSVHALLVPGTGVMDDYDGQGPMGSPFTLANWLSAARASRRPAAFVCVGAGPLTQPISRRLARVALRKASYRSFRDSGSRQFAVSIADDECRRDEVVPDIVFSLPVPAPAQAGRMPRPLVAIPVMRYPGLRPKDASSSNLDRYTLAMAEFCGWLLQEGFAVRVVSTHRADSLAAQQVAELTREALPDLASRWLFSSAADEFADLVRLLSDATAVVATRYHSLIAALMAGVPTISVGYAAKHDELMVATGLGDYSQRIDAVDQRLLRQQFRALVANRERLASAVNAQVACFRQQLIAEEERVRAFLISSKQRSVGVG